MSMLIGEILDNSVREHRDVTAVQWLEKREVYGESYGELWERIGRIRRGLQGKEMKGKHIALIGSSSPEWIESYLAVITGGSVAVPLDAGMPAEDLEELLNRSDSEALFISEKNRSMIPGIFSSCPKQNRSGCFRERERNRETGSFR